MAEVTTAFTSIHQHETGLQCLLAASRRERNTTIVIGADYLDGTLSIDIDTQADVHPDIKALRRDLLGIVEALDGNDPMGGDEK